MSTLWFFGGSDLELQNDSHISHINRRAVWSWTPLNHVGNGLLKTQMFLSATWMEIIFFGSCSLQQWWHLPSNSAVMVISDLWPRHQKSSGIRLCRGFYLKCWYPKRIWRHLKWAFGGNLCDITIPPSESWDLKSLVIWEIQPTPAKNTSKPLLFGGNHVNNCPLIPVMVPLSNHFLVGGFNPFEKISVKLGSSSPNRGDEHVK